MPIIIEKAPLDNEDKEKIRTLMQPPPPQEPDPLNQELLITEIKRRQAEANLKEQDAIKRSIEVQNLKEAQMLDNEKTFVDIDYTKARTMRALLH
jgi:hypothetical protein